MDYILFNQDVGRSTNRLYERLPSLFIFISEKKLPTVPETLLKKRKNKYDVKKARAFARKATQKVCFTNSSI